MVASPAMVGHRQNIKGLGIIKVVHKFPATAVGYAEVQPRLRGRLESRRISLLQKREWSRAGILRQASHISISSSTLTCRSRCSLHHRRRRQSHTQSRAAVTSTSTATKASICSSFVAAPAGSSRERSRLSGAVEVDGASSCCASMPTPQRAPLLARSAWRFQGRRVDAPRPGSGGREPATRDASAKTLKTAPAKLRTHSSSRLVGSTSHGGTSWKKTTE